MSDRIHRYLQDLAEQRTRKKDPAYAAAMDSRKVEGGYIVLDDNHTIDQMFTLIMRPSELNPWYRWYLTTSNKLTDIKRLPKKVRWFVQRGRRGYSDRDLWGFDGYLASIIVNGALQLREQAHGYPVIDDDFTFEQWQRELTMIAEGFNIYQRNEYVPEETWRKFQKYFPAMWD